MADDQGLKHICKFCRKSFACGRSLGGHMRSHLINISSADHSKTKVKLPRNNPSIVNGKSDLKKTNKPLNTIEDDTFLQEKFCKECGRSFQSWKALFGHMKRHSENDHHQKPIMDSQSDNEAATRLCRRKRSDRSKRYTKATTSSSSLTIANSSSCVSEMDQQEQEEVALSLIILSMDKRDWGGLNSVVDSSENNSEFLEANKTAKTSYMNTKSRGEECVKIKKLRNGKLEATTLHSEVKQLGPKSTSIPCNRPKIRKLEVYAAESHEFETDDLDTGCNEPEVNSPKNLINKTEQNRFETDGRNNKSRRRKLQLVSGPSNSELSQGFEKRSKFMCTICKKAFPSYQSLGGHSASHKKFKGFCAEKIEHSTNDHGCANSKLITVSAAKTRAEVGRKEKKQQHECPICFKVFASGQALGGHKRSHLTSDQATYNTSVAIQKPTRDIRDFLDLNMPAPVEEDCNDFIKPWRILPFPC